MKTLIAFLPAFALLVQTLPAPPKDHKPYVGSAELERIKTLAGTWSGTIDHGQGPMELSVVYRVVAGGSAVEERAFADTPMEMVTMYHDKDGKPALTHYCMLHNQPAMKFRKSNKKSISFDFDSSCGIDPKEESHMHALTLTFNDDGTITHNWTHFEGGKAMGPHPYTLKRVE